MDAIALRRDGRKGTPEEHHARRRPTNAVSPAGACPPAATVCFSKLVLTLHGSFALSLAADVVVLPLHTRH